MKLFLKFAAGPAAFLFFYALPYQGNSPNAGIAMPWAGAAAGTAFATGQIEMKTMIRIGLTATLTFPILVAAIHIGMAPFR